MVSMIISNIRVNTVYYPTIWIKEMIRKEKNFLAQPCSCILVKTFKGKNRFIKGYISRNINSPSAGFQAFKTLMSRAVAKKHASSGAKRKLMSIIRPEIRPTSTPEHTK
jgi:hypothetical protein